MCVCCMRALEYAPACACLFVSVCEMAVLFVRARIALGAAVIARHAHRARAPLLLPPPRAQVDSGTSLLLRRREGRERAFHIDDDLSPDASSESKANNVMNDSSDPIVAIAASDKCLVVARESGAAHRYSLPHIALEEKFDLKCKPAAIAINCASTRLTVIDSNSTLTLFDMTAAPAPASGEAGEGAGPTRGAFIEFEKKDVWDMIWSDDVPELFAYTEKTRVFIVRGTTPDDAGMR